MAAVDARTGAISQQETRPYGLVKKGYTYFADGDVLFAKITPCMQNGKHAIARSLIDGLGFGTTEFHVIRPGPNVTAEWVHSFIRQPWVLQEATRYFTGAVGQQRVPEHFLADLDLPLPPIPEQRRIAGILKEQMAEVEQARKATEAQLEAARALPAAYLREVFESEEAKNWPRKKIGDVAKVQSGYAFKSEWFVESGIRLLRNANVFQGHLAWDDVVYLSNSRRGEFEDYELQKGDVILSLDRPVVKNGLKVARVTDNDLPSLLLQRVGRFRITGGVLPEFLYSFLQTPRFIRAITGHDQSLGVPHVSPGQVEDVEIPIPPIPVQHQTVAMVREQTANAEKLLLRLKCKEDGAEQEGATDVVDKLPAALLRRAFSGDI